MSLQWAYALALVPNAAGTAVDRLLLSFTTGWEGDNTNVFKAPTGCIVSLSLVGA